MDDTRALFLRLKSTAKISDSRSVSKISPFLFWDHGTSHLGKKAKGKKFYTDLTEFQVTLWWVSGLVGIATVSAVGMGTDT